MALADEKYVLFTTYKKDGTAVSSPVWIADLGDGRLGFTTDLDSWKVKRLKRNPSVQLQPCSMRGEVKPGSSVVEGSAVAVDDVSAECKTVHRSIQRKYRLAMAAIGVATRVQQLLGKGGDRGAIVISLNSHSDAQ